LTAPKGADQAGAEHGLLEFAADDAVAVFAGVRALGGADQFEGGFGDGAHGFDIVLEAAVEHRADVQGAFRGVGVPGAARAVAFEQLGQTIGVVGEVFERDGAVFDEGDWFALLLHGHHDVEAGGAQVGDGGLEGGVQHFDHAAPVGARAIEAEAEIAHHGGEAL
jgi:hypothetical protein